MAYNDINLVQLNFSEFNENILENLKNIQSRGDFCDMTLACDDKTIPAHKFIVASSSSVLANILKQNNSFHPCIYLRGVQYTDLLNLLDFMYKGGVEIRREELAKFLAVAKDLKIKGLYEETTEIDIRNKNKWNVNKCYSSPEQYGHLKKDYGEKIQNFEYKEKYRNEEMVKNMTETYIPKRKQ